MTQPIYSMFYKQFGVRRLQNLISPRFIELTSFPRNAMLHYLTYDGNVDLDTNKLYFKGYSKKIIVDVVEQLVGMKGSPKRKPIVVKNLIRSWILNHKQFKYVHNGYKTILDPLTLLVNNYNYFNEVYRYIDMPLTPYFKFWNNQNTLWSTINSIANECSREHFVLVNISNDLPSYSFLNIFINRVNPTLLKVFDTPEKLMILEIWKWLSSDYRTSSVINNIETKNLNKVNVVLVNANNQSVIVNLGYLNSWIDGQDNSTEFTTVIQYKALQIQKLFLKLAIDMHTNEPVDIIETTDTVEEVDELDSQEKQAMKEEEDDFLDEHEASEEEPLDDTASMAYLINNTKTSNKLKPSSYETEFKDVETNDVNLVSKLVDIDEELKTLEVINNKKLSDRGIKLATDGSEIEEISTYQEKTLDEVRSEVLIPKTTENTLLDILNTSAELGSISAADYKTLLKEINSFNGKKDPYGSASNMLEMTTISNEELAINKDKSTIKPIKTVLDNNMLQSSLLSFDSDYIKNVIKKDILSMTSSIQKSGIIIKNHEIELDTSVLGTYENHTLELKPINGTNNIIRFRIPKIEEDGTFKANGSKYIMRKQRVDNPIRKISPNEVALTSYYGKSFISTGTKKANSSLEWIMRQINKSVFDDNSYISKVAPANVFDNNIKTPYIYGALSNYYKSFKAGIYNLYFDYSLRHEIYDNLAIESDDKILVGITDTSEPILVDFNNEFYIFKGLEFISIGNVYDVLQLPARGAPVDFTELKVFNKSIPVGIYIAYFIGFKNLVKLLEAEHEIVTVSPRTLRPDQYSIVFKDTTYIFSKRDKVASMILSGFLQFDKQIKTYNSDLFDSKDIYFNLLKNKGVTSIYIREFDLLNKLFIDPITEGILKDMNEPTTFIGLLLRATEMLTTYHHPDSQDLSNMRIRGSERISGFIYKELVSSIRQFHNRNIANRSKVEMSPYRIWQSITTDNSVKLVEEINPIQSLKDQEVVTYVGEGGRNKDSMNKKSRAYHPKDMGVISEATVDSSDVGINAYLSANPNFKNLRGLITNNKVINPTTLLSTSAQLAVGAMNDD